MRDVEIGRTFVFVPIKRIGSLVAQAAIPIRRSQIDGLRPDVGAEESEPVFETPVPTHLQEWYVELAVDWMLSIV